MMGLLNALKTLGMIADLIVWGACMMYALDNSGDLRLRKIDFAVALIMVINIVVIVCG